MTTCALKIQESETPIMTTVQTETFDRTDGVRVVSICRTRRSSRASWSSVAKEASDDQSPKLSYIIETTRKRTVHRLSPEIVDPDSVAFIKAECDSTLISHDDPS
jgi:hypothetical protein